MKNYTWPFTASVKSSIKETTGTLRGTHLVPSPQQCYHKHGTHHPEVSCKNKPPVVPQPLYSLGLFPAEFFLFPKLKVNLKG
jgi:hypothetical protein